MKKNILKNILKDNKDNNDKIMINQEEAIECVFIGYVRVSTKEQIKNNSIENQEIFIKNFAYEMFNITIDTIIYDSSSAFKNHENDQINLYDFLINNEMIFKKNKLIIIVYMMDRLSRNPNSEIMNLIFDYQKYGYIENIYSVSDENADMKNNFNTFYNLILSSYKESYNKSKRTTDNNIIKKLKKTSNECIINDLYEKRIIYKNCIKFINDETNLIKEENYKKIINELIKEFPNIRWTKKLIDQKYNQYINNLFCEKCKKIKSKKKNYIVICDFCYKGYHEKCYNFIFKENMVYKCIECKNNNDNYYYDNENFDGYQTEEYEEEKIKKKIKIEKSDTDLNNLFSSLQLKQNNNNNYYYEEDEEELIKLFTNLRI